jgi:hypothetical protein
MSGINIVITCCVRSSFRQGLPESRTQGCEKMRCRYREGYFNVGSRTHGRDTFLCTDKEKYPKEIRPMPLASCASRIYRGLSKGTPVPLTTCGIPAAPLRAIPDKCSDARRGIREMGVFVGWGELVNPNKYCNSVMLELIHQANLTNCLKAP